MGAGVGRGGSPGAGSRCALVSAFSRISSPTVAELGERGFSVLGAIGMVIPEVTETTMRQAVFPTAGPPGARRARSAGKALFAPLC
ncbi:hypothetical protein CAL14_13330 [Bordetella genomosp. 9]|nr:hypothetical protein CAL14_13330 [Bordetella genomosp. 9]